MQRRRFIVDAKLQGGLLAAFVFQMLLFASILTLALYLPAIRILGSPDDHAPYEVDAAREMVSLDILFWPALATGIVLAVLLALRTTHQIAGPLLAIRRIYDALIRREDPGPLRLRRGDYLAPEAEHLDRVVRSVVSDRERLASLEKSIRRCLEEIEDERGADAERLRMLIRAHLATDRSESDAA